MGGSTSKVPERSSPPRPPAAGRILAFKRTPSAIPRSAVPSTPMKHRVLWRANPPDCLISSMHFEGAPERACCRAIFSQRALGDKTDVSHITPAYGVMPQKGAPFCPPLHIYSYLPKNPFLTASPLLSRRSLMARCPLPSRRRTWMSRSTSFLAPCRARRFSHAPLLVLPVWTLNFVSWRAEFHGGRGRSRS